MVECEYEQVTDIYSVQDVLIDTWWNVNKSSDTAFMLVSSFNRYMVECELVKIQFDCNCI